jgi:hypothetical protein
MVRDREREREKSLGVHRCTRQTDFGDAGRGGGGRKTNSIGKKLTAERSITQTQTCEGVSKRVCKCKNENVEM